MSSFVQNIKQHLINLPGWRSKRKIVVFESDDWGSIRTPSLEALDSLKKTGIPVEKCNYMLNDSLENANDLLSLFEVLQQYKDSNGQSAKFTANTIVANPDFEKIKASGYQDYFFEPFTESYKKYHGDETTFTVFKSGIDTNIFKPQLHGREHLNISRWMTDLKNGNEETLLAFDLKMTGVSAHVSKSKRGSYQAAFDGGTNEILFNHLDILQDATDLFTMMFGFHSKSFIAPNYVWNDNLESYAATLGIDYLQGSSAQRISNDYGTKPKIVRHYTGQKNKHNQIYMVRNCFFEPYLEPHHGVEDCIRSISNSFLLGKPAIISTHRVNYIGSLQKETAQNSLEQLDELLRLITTKWSEVEFMFSDELGNLITKND